MGTHTEKLVFGFLGAITAIVVGLAVYGDLTILNPQSSRTPASEQQHYHEPTVYSDFID